MQGAGVGYGFATVSTDTGHNSTTGDGTWADQAPEKVIDWGYVLVSAGTIEGPRHGSCGNTHVPVTNVVFTDHRATSDSGLCTQRHPP